MITLRKAKALSEIEGNDVYIITDNTDHTWIPLNKEIHLLELNVTVGESKKCSSLRAFFRNKKRIILVKKKLS